MQFINHLHELGESDPLVRAMMQANHGIPVQGVAEQLVTLDQQANDAGFLETPTVIAERLISQNDELCDDLEIADTCVGPYNIIRRIGHGGFSQVFEAYHRASPDVRVAVKVFENRGLDHIDRLDIERLVLQQLSHPHLVSALDFGQTADGKWYLVMNLVNGIRIDHYVSKQKLSFASIAKIFIHIADALEYAHSNDVVHRDLKPNNILVQNGDIPVVADFGLAKRLNLAGQSVTATGALIGTLGYLAPEQASPSRLEVTRAVDIYGLGATLYCVLTGRAPLDQTDIVRALYELRTLVPKKPSVVRPEVPTDLELVCMKCLEKAPRDRYESMHELSHDFRRFVNGKRVAARKPGWRHQLWRWCNANRALAGLSLGLGGAVLAGLFVAIVLWQQAIRQKTKTEKLLQTAHGIVQYGDRAAETMLVQTPGSLGYRHERQRKSVHFFDALVEQFPGDDDLLRKSATAYFRLGKVSCLLGFWEEASTAYEVALNRFDLLSRKFRDDDSLQFDLFHSLLALDMIDDNLFHIPLEERTNIVKALEIIQQLMILHPENINYRDAYACTASIAGARLSSTDPVGAIAMLEDAHDVAKRLKAELPQPCLQWRHVGGTASALASVHLFVGDLDRSKHWLQIAMLEFDEFLKRPDLDPGELLDWANCLSIAIRLERAKGNHPAADEYAQEWLVFMEECVAKYPDYYSLRDALSKASEFIGTQE